MFYVSFIKDSVRYYSYISVVIIILNDNNNNIIILLLYVDGPEVVEPSSNLFATLEEDNITLICGSNLVGNPPPVVTWLSNTNDEIGLSDNRFQINSGPDIVSLTIFNATQNDSGTWRCVLALSAPNGTLIQQLERNLTLIVLGKSLFMQDVLFAVKLIHIDHSFHVQLLQVSH